MAKTILILAAHKGAGQTTIAVNLASALARRGKQVLIADQGGNAKLKDWLGLSLTADRHSPSAQPDAPAITASWTNIDYWDMAGTELIPAQFLTYYQYIFLLPAQDSACESMLPNCERILVCCSLEEKDAAQQVIALDQRLSRLTRQPQPINLVVLNKINTKEWHNNLESFSLLADYFGDEKIADPLPHCERIHDLPLQGRTVWELSQENLQDAFRRLTEMVESW